MPSVIEISDIEHLQFLYKDEYPIDVEIWDTVGEEKYNELYTYSKNYVQGKHGVILLVNSHDYITSSTSVNSCNSDSSDMEDC